MATDYISREAAIKMRHACKKDCSTCDFAIEGDSWCQGELFVIDILRVPAADVVEVVRCKDCEWWTKQDASLQGRCALAGQYPTGEWFCANGQRRSINE